MVEYIARSCAQAYCARSLLARSDSSRAFFTKMAGVCYLLAPTHSITDIRFMMPASILLALHSIESQTNLIECFIKNKLCLYRRGIKRFELCYDLSVVCRCCISKYLYLKTKVIIQSINGLLSFITVYIGTPGVLNRTFPSM